MSDHNDDDDSTLSCFTAVTLIATGAGAQPVESLATGDLIWTLNAGLRPIRWIARHLVTRADRQREARLVAQGWRGSVLLQRGEMAKTFPFPAGPCNFCADRHAAADE